MFDLDHWREIRDALTRNKLRTGLTAFGVFWGILMLIVMLGSGNGLSNGVNAGFSGGGTNSFFIWTQRTGKPYRGLPAGRSFEMTNDDVAAVRTKIDGLRLICPRAQIGGYRGGENVNRGTKSGAFSVYGDVPEIREVQAMKIVKGRFLNPLDLAERRKVAVIGTRVAEVLFEPGEDPIGELIRIQGIYFRVLGVFKAARSGDDGDGEAQAIYVPLTTFQTAFNWGNTIGWLALTAKDDVSAEETERDVLALLAARHQVAPDDRRAFGHFNTAEEFGKIQGLFAGIRALIWIVGIGTLAAGVIGVSNIMLVIVRERTREIGVRRAIGATPASIQVQIMLEAVLLTSIAGYGGLILGMIFLDLTAAALPADGSSTMFAAPGVSLVTALQALTLLIIAGTLAGIIPARRAVTLSPVAALR